MKPFFGSSRKMTSSYTRPQSGIKKERNRAPRKPRAREVLKRAASAEKLDPPPTPLISESALTPSQLLAANQAINSDQNVFVTGAAGVGKSYLLRFIIQQLQIKYPQAGEVAVTASTGFQKFSAPMFFSSCNFQELLLLTSRE